MDHAEAREMLEVAAVEPDGIERLEAGDTPASAAIAGHLAGCPACVAELERLRATAELARSALGGPAPASSAEVGPPPELRERTLAYVRAYGRPGGLDAPVAAASLGADDRPVGARTDIGARGRRPTFGRAAVLLGLAAALVVGVGLGGLVAASQQKGQIDAQAAAIEALTKVNRWTLRVASAPDATSVSLSSPSGGPGSGSVLYSPATTELIAAMEGVAPPPPGREYRCWVRAGGTNAVLGKMYFGGDVGYWGGRSPAVASLPTGAVFGVSLVDVATGQAVGDPVLTGTS